MAGDAARRRFPPGGVFVGRDWELAQLRAALSDAQSGRGQLFVVSGEAGIGKTRLVGKLADLAENEQARVLWGRCWEGQEAPAFWPWIQIFRNMIRNPGSRPVCSVGQSPPDLPQLIAELGESLAPDGDALPYPPSDQARFRLFDAAAMSIRTAAESQPLVLIMEDLHEADRSSLLLLEFLARQLSDIPLLVLATSREPEADLQSAVRDTVATIAGSGHMMSLPGLRRDEISEFLGQGFDIVLTEESLSAVQEGTGGNPLFLDELARRFVAERRFREVPGGGLEVPEGLKAPIRSRLAALPADAQALVALASVVGREFAFELLVAASGLARDTVLATLGKLAAARLVDPAGFGLGPYRFDHALIRETIYQDLSAQQRWHLHRRVGEAIETLHPVDLEGYLDHLAYHFSEAAALGELDRAIEYSRQAGNRAASQLGYDEAIRHYRRALELAQADQHPAPKRFDLLLALGDARWWAGHVCQASETFRAAASLARELTDPHRLAEAALRVGEVGYGGAYVQAWAFDPAIVELLDEALDALGDQESLLKVRVLARLSTTLCFSPFDSVSRRDSLSRASLELARRMADGPTLAYALHARHLAVSSPDNIEERLTLSVEIVELAQQTGDLSTELIGHVWCLADLLEIGDVQGADREIEAYDALARRVGYPHFIAYGFMFRAMQAMLRGEFADAEALAGRSLALGDQVGDGNVRFSHHVQMAVLRALQGRPQECAAYCEPAVHEQPQLVKLMGLAFCCLAGDRASSAEAFPLIWRARDRIPPTFWLSIAGFGITLLAASSGASHEGAAIYDLVRPYERRWAWPGRDAVAPLGPVAYYLGVLAAALSRFDAAAGHFEVALEAAERVGSRPYLALAQGAYGAMLARRGPTFDRPRATRLLADALKAATDLGMAQLYDEVVAARAGLLPDPIRTESQRDSLPEGSSYVAVFRGEGEYWTISFERIVIRMKDAKGLHYLRRLLAAPGYEFHVLDLAAGTPPSSMRKPGHHVDEGRSLAGADADKMLDPAAKAAYRARIERLRTDIEEADGNNDLERAGRARAELDFIVAELARAVGLGGRDRTIPSPGERARSAVSKSVRTCVKRIEKAHPALGAHLATAVRTGYFCSYQPDPRTPVEWRT